MGGGGSGNLAARYNCGPMRPTPWIASLGMAILVPLTASGRPPEDATATGPSFR